MDDMDGHHIIMNNVGPGESFGEAYCFLGTDAPIYICAVTEAEVLWMSPARIKAPSPPFQAMDWELSNRFISALAARTLSMNQRIQILSQGTLRRKLITFLSQYATTQGTPSPSPLIGPAWQLFWGLTAAPCPGNYPNCAKREFWTFTAINSAS